MIAGIVLAAGASTRMGRPKAALPLGAPGDTVVRRVVSALLDAGLSRVAVVSGAHPDAVREALDAIDPRVCLVHNASWPAGQLSSLLCGLDAVDDPELDAVAMNLVDVPLVSAATIRLLIERWRETGAPVVRPARGDTHGHPVLFDRRLFAELRAADVSRGAKPVVHAHAGALLNVPVEDEGAFLDLDTPADYERALQMAARMAARASIE